MNPASLETVLESLEQEQPLTFNARQNALSFITSSQDFIKANPGVMADSLSGRLAALRARLVGLDEALYQTVRTHYQQGRYTPQSFRAELESLTDYARWNPNETRHTFDYLDVLFDGILQLDDAPYIYKPTADLEMVFYLPTPARIVLILADYADLEQGDVFYDLGSGVGRVPLLLNLVTGLRVRGVEFNPVLHNLAVRSQSLLKLPSVSFIQADARTADYSDGTVFYMFTPFQGAMFQSVLERLQEEAARRPIRIIARGGCIPTIKEQSWLREKTPSQLEAYRIALFESRAEVI